MSAPTPGNPLRAITCVVCGEQKGANNHWWLLSVRIKMLPFDGLSKTSPILQLAITPWNQIMAEEQEQSPACGNSCAQKLTERFFTSKSLEPSRRPISEPAPAEGAAE
jgi:hypothetical protein